MTDREILQAAIKKAISNGYKIYSVDSVNIYHPDIISNAELAELFTKHNLYFTHIYSHKFAKAFWGEDRTVYYFEMDNRKFYLASWQYHLQQMVLEEEPLKYLEKFL